MFACYITPAYSIVRSGSVLTVTEKAGKMPALPEQLQICHVTSLKSSLGSTVARALQDPKVFAPRTHALAVLVSHNPRDLVQMS
jgi:hypothetical protein